MDNQAEVMEKADVQEESIESFDLLGGEEQEYIEPESTEEEEQEEGPEPGDIENLEGPVDVEDMESHVEEIKNEEKSDNNTEENTDEDIFGDFVKGIEDESRDEKISSLAVTLGFSGIESEADLARGVHELRIKAEQANQKFDNEQIQKHIDDIKSISSSGGDWRSYRDKDLELTNLQDAKTSLVANVDNLRKYAETADVSKKKEFLLYHLTDRKNGLGLTNEQANERVEAMSEVDVAYETNRHIKDLVSSATVELNSLNGSIKSISADKEQIKAQAETNKKLFSESVGKAAQSFEDEDGLKNVTELVRKQFTNVMSSNSVDVQLPVGLFKELFAGEDGKFSMERAISLFAHSKYGSRKRDAVLKKLEMENFRGLTSPKKPKESVKKTLQNNSPKSTTKNADSIDDLLDGQLDPNWNL